MFPVRLLHRAFIDTPLTNVNGPDAPSESRLPQVVCWINAPWGARKKPNPESPYEMLGVFAEKSAQFWKLIKPGSFVL